MQQLAAASVLVCQRWSKLVCASRLYQCNVCGEGGEYESLVLDCPLFKHARIVLVEWDIVLQSPDSFAPVGLLHPVAFHLEPKGQPGAVHPQTEGLQPGAFHGPTKGQSSLCATEGQLEETVQGTISQVAAAASDSSAQSFTQSTTSEGTADKESSVSTVIEVPADVSLGTSTASQRSGSPEHSAQQSAASWATSVQLYCGSEYVRAVCCPQQRSQEPPSDRATAEALDAALAAVSQGGCCLLGSLLWQRQDKVKLHFFGLL